MKNPKIENTLRVWAKDMVSRYDWLTIRFEYNEDRHHYLVSYYPGETIEQNDEFCLESSDFEDCINLEYLNEAPLFCDDERLFHLSPNAETISKPKAANRPKWLEYFRSSPLPLITFVGGTTETRIDKSRINEYALAA